MIDRLTRTWATFLDNQHREPHGLIGRIIGERMLRQHLPETNWTIDVLTLRPTDRVLEIGFGAGRGLALAAQTVSHGTIAGVDRSSTMLRSARNRNREPIQHGRMLLLQADLCALPFAKRGFDKIFSIHTFYFWPEPFARCQELLALLTQGGRAVITFATMQTLPSGEHVVWPIQQQAELLVQDLLAIGGCTATLIRGPDSRQFNNVALVIGRLAT